MKYQHEEIKCPSCSAVLSSKMALKIHRRNTKCRPNYIENKKAQKNKNKDMTASGRRRQEKGEVQSMQEKEIEPEQEQNEEPKHIEVESTQKELVESVYNNNGVKVKPVFIPSKERSLLIIFV